MATRRAAHFCAAMAGAFLAPGLASAGELQQLYRSTRIEAMGGASTALADDDSALYLNPAGLAGIERLQFNYLVTDISVSTDVVATVSDLAKAFSKLSGSSLNLLLGKNIYAEAQIAPNLIGPGFGFSVLADQQLAIHAENRALPQINLGYQTTDGFQLGYATSVGRGKRSLFGKRAELRVGVAGKMLFRRGGYRKLSPVTLFQLVNPSSLQQLIGPWGSGLGLDVGSQFVFEANSLLTLYAGLAMTDVGDTNFGDGPDPIKANLSGGFAARYKLGAIHFKGIYDQRHILHVTDWRKKNHFGVEVELPMISLFAGINQVYPTYGMSFDAWIVKVTAASYVEEQGSFVYQDPERRWMLRLALKFDL